MIRLILSLAIVAALVRLESTSAQPHHHQQHQHSVSCPIISCPSISCPTITCPTPATHSHSSNVQSVSTPTLTIPSITIPSSSPACPTIYCPAITCSSVSCNGGSNGGYNPSYSTGFPPHTPSDPFAAQNSGGAFPAQNVGGGSFPAQNSNGAYPLSSASITSGTGYPAFSPNPFPTTPGQEYNFTGHYQSAHNNATSKFDEFLNALGVSFISRPKVVGAAQEIFITQNPAAPGTYQVKNALTAIGDTYYSFRDGEEFNENRLTDGKNVRSIIQVRGARWAQSQFGAPEVNILWEFGVPTPRDLTITSTVNGVSTVRRFVKKN